jgi:hypothetical protein
VLVIIDHRKALPWVYRKLAPKLTVDSIVLIVTRKGLIQANTNSRFSNGNIHSASIRKTQEKGSCLEFVFSKRQILSYSQCKSLSSLSSTISEIITQYGFKKCALVCASDHLASAAMVSTYLHLNLPPLQLEGHCLYDPNRAETNKFFHEVDLGLPMYYIREFFRVKIQHHLIDRFNWISNDTFQYFNPISIYILNEAYSHKNLKPAQLGHHTLKRFGSYQYLDSCLRSVDLSFTLSHLEKQGLIINNKGALEVTEQGFEIASLFDKGAVDRCIYALLALKEDRFTLIDICLKRLHHSITEILV